MEPSWLSSRAQTARHDPSSALADAQRIRAVAAQIDKRPTDASFEQKDATKVMALAKGLEQAQLQHSVQDVFPNRAPEANQRRRPPPPPPKKPALSKTFPLVCGSSPPTPPAAPQTRDAPVTNLVNCRKDAIFGPRVPPLPPRRPQPLPTPPSTPELSSFELCAAAPWPSAETRKIGQRPNNSHSPPRLPPRRPTCTTPPSVAATAEWSSRPQRLPERSTSKSPDASFDPRATSSSSASKTPKKANNLCGECSKIDFAQFGNTLIERASIDPGAQSTAHLINLKHLLSKRHNCNFCSLLFQALCLPAHDPLRDEELQESILKDKKFQDLRSKEAPFWVDFETWAGNREKFSIKKEAKWPFGHTYDDVNVKEIKADNEREIDFEEGEGSERRDAAAINQGARAGLAAGKHFDNNGDRAKAYGFAMDVLPDMGVINAMTKKGVPAVVRVMVHGISHPKSGVLDITVFGCAKARGRDIKTLSHFAIRVASPVPSTLPKHEKNLRYGRLVDRKAIDFNLCRTWLTHCCAAHGTTCNSPKWSATLEKPSGIPFRLVDVQDGSIVERDPQHHEYAALSYVWGDVSHRAGILSLSNKNVHSLSAPGALGRYNVGRAISDAIDIIRSLGLRYLWADRLCIIQDSDTDKAHQIGQMDRIYGGALVTIVAASGTHLNEPITGVSTTRSVSQLAERVTSDPVVNVLLPMQSAGYPDLNPWASRAWTLQEKLLSKRLLIFHDGVVDFRCPYGTMHEDMSAMDADTRLPAVGWLSLANTSLFSEIKTGSYGRSGPRLLRSSIFADYAGLIQEYTPRQMTNPIDAINAVMGMLKILIANQQNPQGRKRLLNGLPEEFFDQALHWQCAAKEGVRLRLRKDRRFPTWSWAAWEAAECVDPESRQLVLCPGGVQYEATYRVQTDNRGQLQKVLQKNRGGDAEQPEERIRPLLRWYTADNLPPVPPPRTQPSSSGNGKFRPAPPPLPPRKGSASPLNNTPLRPLNSNGLGLALSPSTSLEEWTSSVSLATNNLALDCPLPALPPALTKELRPGYHLVFRTLIAQFSLGETRTRTETLWRKTEDGKLLAARELHIRETAILAENGKEVGRVSLPYEVAAGGVGEFVVLSEGQFFGDEESIEVGEYPLFNVMLVRWEGDIAERVGLGRVTKEGWWGGRWREEVVVLG